MIQDNEYGLTKNSDPLKTIIDKYSTVSDKCTKKENK